MDGDPLFDRRARVSIDVPVSTPGNFSGVTSDRLIIDGIGNGGAPGLRVRFKTMRSLAKAPNTVEVVLYNLNADHRGKLQAKGVKVQLEAGYASTGLARYAHGDLRTISHKQQGADWITTMRIGDGERSYRHAQMDESFAAGTTARNVIDKIVAAMGLPLGHIPADLIIGFTFDAGYVVSGKCSTAMDRVTKALGYSWSVQDGAVQILAKGETLQVAVPQLSSTSGLVGSPEFGSPDKKGGAAVLKVKSLLMPFRPGAIVNVQSATYKGNLRIRRVSTAGDTMGGEWYSHVDGEIIR